MFFLPSSAPIETHTFTQPKTEELMYLVNRRHGQQGFVFFKGRH